MAAFALSKYAFRGRNAIFLIIIATLARFAWWGYHHRSVEVLLITIGVMLATSLPGV